MTLEPLAHDVRLAWRSLRRAKGFIAARTRYRDLRAPHATLYAPAAQLIVSAQSLAVRSSAPLARVADIVREQGSFCGACSTRWILSTRLHW